MSALTGWAGSGAALVIIGVAWVLMHHRNKHGGRIHSSIHPMLSRAEIFGFYVGGCVLALGTLGGWVTGAASWALSLSGSAGFSHGAIIIAGVFLLFAVGLGFLFEPEPKIAYLALALPFVASLTGGKLHGILTAVPGASIAAAVMHWIGG